MIDLRKRICYTDFHIKILDEDYESFIRLIIRFENGS